MPRAVKRLPVIVRRQPHGYHADNLYYNCIRDRVIITPARGRLLVKQLKTGLARPSQSLILCERHGRSRVEVIYSTTPKTAKAAALCERPLFKKNKYAGVHAVLYANQAALGVFTEKMTALLSGKQHSLAISGLAFPWIQEFGVEVEFHLKTTIPQRIPREELPKDLSYMRGDSPAGYDLLEKLAGKMPIPVY